MKVRGRKPNRCGSAKRLIAPMLSKSLLFFGKNLYDSVLVLLVSVSEGSDWSTRASLK